MILHIYPTVTADFQRDYVLLIPAPEGADPVEQARYLNSQGHSPATVERDVIFAGLTQFQRIYQDVIVHTVPL